MANDPDPNIHRLDLRTAITFVALMVAASGSAVAIARFAWLADIQRVVDGHTIERQQWRSGVDARISRVEEQCHANREWREKAERELDGLHQWRTNCSQKQAGFEAWKEQHDRQDAAIIGALNRRQDWLEQRLK